MISLLLAEKIFSLFLIMFTGVLLIKLKILTPSDSRVISLLILYLITPCVILSAFQVEFTPEIRSGFILALAAALVIHVILIFTITVLGKVLKLTGVEQAASVYSNAGNLIIPIVISLLGKEWVIYSSAFVIVQLFLIWSHGKMLLCGEHRLEFKKVFANINMISILVGLIILLTGVRFPHVVQDAVDSIAGTIGPLGMLVTGILIATTDLKKLRSFRRLWLITLLRLVLLPMVIAVVLKYSPLASLAPNGTEILFVSLLATITPSSGGLTQMAVIYGSDPEYATAINVVTTLLCIVTMPLIVAFYFG